VLFRSPRHSNRTHFRLLASRMLSTLERLGDSISSLRGNSQTEERDDINSPTIEYKHFDDFEQTQVESTSSIATESYYEEKGEENNETLDRTQEYISRVKTFGSTVLSNLAEAVANSTTASRREKISNFAGAVTNSASDKLQVLSSFTNTVASTVSTRMLKGKPKQDPLLDSERNT